MKRCASAGPHADAPRQKLRLSVLGLRNVTWRGLGRPQMVGVEIRTQDLSAATRPAKPLLHGGNMNCLSANISDTLDFVPKPQRGGEPLPVELSVIALIASPHQPLPHAPAIEKLLGKATLDVVPASAAPPGHGRRQWVSLTGCGGDIHVQWTHGPADPGAPANPNADAAAQPAPTPAHEVDAAPEAVPVPQQRPHTAAATRKRASAPENALQVAALRSPTDAGVDAQRSTAPTVKVQDPPPSAGACSPCAHNEYANPGPGTLHLHIAAIRPKVGPAGGGADDPSTVPDDLANCTLRLSFGGTERFCTTAVEPRTPGAPACGAHTHLPVSLQTEFDVVYSEGAIVALNVALFGQRRAATPAAAGEELVMGAGTCEIMHSVAQVNKTLILSGGHEVVLTYRIAYQRPLQEGSSGRPKSAYPKKFKSGVFDVRQAVESLTGETDEFLLHAREASCGLAEDEGAPAAAPQSIPQSVVTSLQCLTQQLAMMQASFQGQLRQLGERMGRLETKMDDVIYTHSVVTHAPVEPPTPPPVLVNAACSAEVPRALVPPAAAAAEDDGGKADTAIDTSRSDELDTGTGDLTTAVASSSSTSSASSASSSAPCSARNEAPKPEAPKLEPPAAAKPEPQKHEVPHPKPDPAPAGRAEAAKPEAPKQDPPKRQPRRGSSDAAAAAEALALVEAGGALEQKGARKGKREKEKEKEKEREKEKEVKEKEKDVAKEKEKKAAGERKDRLGPEREKEKKERSTAPEKEKKEEKEKEKDQEKEKEKAAAATAPEQGGYKAKEKEREKKMPAAGEGAPAAGKGHPAVCAEERPAAKPQQHPQHRPEREARDGKDAKERDARREERKEAKDRTAREVTRHHHSRSTSRAERERGERRDDGKATGPPPGQLPLKSPPRQPVAMQPQPAAVAGPLPRGHGTRAGKDSGAEHVTGRERDRENKDREKAAQHAAPKPQHQHQQQQQHDKDRKEKKEPRGEPCSPASPPVEKPRQAPPPPHDASPSPARKAPGPSRPSSGHHAKRTSSPGHPWATGSGGGAKVLREEGGAAPAAAAAREKDKAKETPARARDADVPRRPASTPLVAGPRSDVQCINLGGGGDHAELLTLTSPTLDEEDLASSPPAMLTRSTNSGNHRLSRPNSGNGVRHVVWSTTDAEPPEPPSLVAR
eukprot:TRINITY_DN1140_c0_g1_i2.p1 TRINITY_DN1140_c0_g1~~TRINITY_DN1140_c0_g1_i2.p1  ORF type:complete len:1163 (+),score=370.24 TRINITY_DN1140_c0_g1_i2:117-3605(+)